LHKFPTGSEYQTWSIPPEWNVRKAVLMAGEDVIASHDECPLFVARYSLPYAGTVSKQEPRPGQPRWAAMDGDGPL